MKYEIENHFPTPNDIMNLGNVYQRLLMRSFKTDNTDRNIITSPKSVNQILYAS